MKNKKQKISDRLGSLDFSKPKTNFNKIFTNKKKGTTGLDNALLIDTSFITSNPNQPRKQFKKESLQELADSIKERGVLQPIRVRPKEDKYEIIAGERRWQATKLAGLKEIPCIVVEQNDKETYIDALMENIQRENLNPIDRANALSELKVNLGSPSWEEVGKRLGITKRHIFNLIGLKNLPGNVQEDIRNGALTEKHGRALRTLISDKDKFKEAYNNIKIKCMSGDEALVFTKSLKKSQKPESQKFISEIKKVSQQYQDLLLLSNFQQLDTSQKKFLLESLLEVKDIVFKIIDKLKQ